MYHKDTLPLLLAARMLIEDPQNWTIAMRGRDSYDNYAPPWEPAAVKFCALGALDAFLNCYSEDTTVGMAAHRVLCAANNMLDFYDIARYNNSHTHKDVLRMFDRAIKYMERLDHAAA